jgi:ribosomal protein S18 acetylase RimI-like enzyme
MFSASGYTRVRSHRLHQVSNGSIAAITASAQTPPSADGILIRRATTSIEYRAAAYLRAQAFSVFPESNQTTDFARQAYLRMRGDEKWTELELAVKNDTPRVIPLIATSLEGSIRNNASLCIPQKTKPEWTVATLDVNIGLKLPSEELIGSLPLDSSEAMTKRAYLSNVCVLDSMRRRGLAKRIIEEATEISRDLGVEHLYVHFIHTNNPARSLYIDHCGFEFEAEEKEATARALNRPRRVLLHKKF